MLSHMPRSSLAAMATALVLTVTSSAQQPSAMRIVLMLEDSGLGLGAIRQGAADFIQVLRGHAQFAITAMGAQNLPLVDFTAEPSALFTGLTKMFARNSPPVYVLDGLLEAAQ